jgi:predicted transcriptional regulator
MKDSFTKVLGHLEQLVLDALWARGDASGKDVFEDIKKTRPVALTTVLTVLERLVKKGFVRKMKGESVFMFAPAYSRDEFARKASEGVFKGIAEISRTGVVASLVDVLAGIDPKELDRLTTLIESKKRELSEKGRTLRR